MQGSDNLLVRAAKKLEHEEQRSLVLAYQSGNTEAAGRLLESVAPWILRMLRRFNLPPEIDYDDMMSELYIVLLQALKHYDPQRTKLTTFIYHVVCRRSPRIARRLQGRLANQTVDTMECLELLAEEEPDERVQDILEAIDLADLKEPAKYAVRLWAEGFNYEAIESRLKKKFPSAEMKSADSLVSDALKVIRTEMVAMGHDLPEEAELQKTFW